MKLKASEIKPNPNNPRIIKDEKFKKLVQSIQDFPEMADVREVVVNKDHMILGGNMRFKAMVAAGWKEIPVRVVDWSEDKQREFVIKDNISGGEWDWDTLANEWDIEQLAAWGTDLPSFIENMGQVDHFRDGDPDSKLGDVEDYNNRDSNTLILLYDDAEFKFVIEKIKELITPDDDNPSKVILTVLKNL